MDQLYAPLYYRITMQHEPLAATWPTHWCATCSTDPVQRGVTTRGITDQ